MAQLAAEYDTIAQAAGQARWIQLLEAGGLTADTVDDLVTTDAFGILTTELLRLEADGHDIDDLLPRVIRAGGLTDADDLGSLIRYRIQKITASYQPSTQRTTSLIAGLIPRATGITDPEMQQALTEREQLIHERVAALTEQLLNHPAPWMTILDDAPADTRTTAVRAVAAYRDRWNITSSSPLGAIPSDDAQRSDYERTHAALDAATESADDPASTPMSRRTGRTLS